MACGALAVEIRDEANRAVAGFAGAQRAQHDVVSPGPWDVKEPPVRWPGGKASTN